MRKKIAIGCFLAIFLMMMLPIASAVNSNVTKETMKAQYPIIVPDIVKSPVILDAPAIYELPVIEESPNTVKLVNCDVPDITVFPEIVTLEESKVRLLLEVSIVIAGVTPPE